jgi:extradiol dioxygenase family protein
MDHIVLNVEDDEKMMAFYSKVLMLEAERLQEYRAGMVPFPSVRLNSDTIIDLFPKRMWQKSSTSGQGRSNLNHFCLSLSKETWEDLVKRLKANSVVIEEGPVPRWGTFGILKATLLKRGTMNNPMKQKSACSDRNPLFFLSY